MDRSKTITFYLYPQVRRQAQAGRFNFINRIRTAVEPLGYTIAFDGGREDRLLASADLPGYAMFHMEQPFHSRALTMRKVYHPPFWAIESTGKRWDWHSARAQFDPMKIGPNMAQDFAMRWRGRLFPGVETSPGSHILVPLQGRLTTARSFQTMSPLEMLKATLTQMPTRPVIATLHPGESYTQPEIAALDRLATRHSTLTIAPRGTVEMLAQAHAVVTQNSSVAFNGYFFRKPAILFAKIDFHHIALNVTELGVAGAFAALPDHRPDYDAYLTWFWQQQSINAGRPEAEAQILSALRRGGWAL